MYEWKCQPFPRGRVSWVVSGWLSMDKIQTNADARFNDIVEASWLALVRAVTPRSPHEPHRVATPLELFFDLVFVVAIAQAASGLHHAMAKATRAQGLTGYLMVFFAIWWAWMDFTWFASAYDCDDLPYRLTVFVQITER